MATIDIADKTTLDQLLSRGNVKSVQRGIMVTESGYTGGRTEVTINSINSSKSIMLACSEYLENRSETISQWCLQPIYGITSNTSIFLYINFVVNRRFQTVWQVVEFY